MSPIIDPGQSKQINQQQKIEVEKLLEELRQIGMNDDFLSEHPGGLFNMQCKHVRARQIGTRLGEIGGVELMLSTFYKLKRKFSRQDRNRLSEHLGYCWNNLNDWKY